MSRIKTAIIALFTFAAVLAIVPGAALAAHHVKPPKRHPQAEVFGTLVSFTSNEAVIQTKTEKVSVTLMPTTAYVTYDQSAAIKGLDVGDAVDATGLYFDGTLHADRLRYADAAFPVSKLTRFDGRYSASAAGTLTLRLRRNVMITFNVDANTRYFQNGRRLLAPPTYKANEHILVWAQQYSDQSWLAKIVNVLVPRKR